MKIQPLEKQSTIFQRHYYPRRHQKQHTYKLKSYLPQIKSTGRENNLLNITKQTIDKHQMLYIDFYQNNGIRILEKSPQHQTFQEDQNQTFGKVKVMELNNLSQECKKTLNYFSASKDQRLRRDTVRRSIFSKLHYVDETKQINVVNQKPASSNQQSNSPRKKMYFNIAQRNRKLPKKQKYLIQKFGIITGDHMFKVESKKSLSMRLSTPQTYRQRTISPIRPIFSMRQPKAETLEVKSKPNNVTFYNVRDQNEPQNERYNKQYKFQDPAKQTIQVKNLNQQ